ncbi:MAG: tRNA epoxyqueuosine(34) reductase QueG, partial [Chloroflexota bacterium]
LHQLLAMDDQQFRARYRGSAVTRTKRRGLVRNACVALGNLRDEASVGPLLSVVHDPSSDAIVRGHAAWALGRIGGRRAWSGLEKASKAVAAGSALDHAELEYATELNAALSLATTH